MRKINREQKRERKIKRKRERRCGENKIRKKEKKTNWCKEI